MLLSLIASGLSGGAAAAQTVAVRSGEHEGFTRLVIDFPRRPEWRLGQVGGRNVLSTGQSGLRYDLTGVYRRIGRGRLAAVAGGAGGELLLTLACDCRLRAEELPNQGLVIDIVDGPAPSGIAGARAEPRPASAADSPYPQDEQRGEEGGREGQALLPLLLAPKPAALLPGAFEAPVPDRSPADAAASDPARRSEVAAAARLRLAETLARAAVQGVIAPAAPATDVGGLAAPLQEVGGNLRARTRIDLDLAGAVPVPTADCLAPGRLDPADWLGGGDDPAAALSALRGALIDPTGAPDPAAHAGLARAYIALTFGAEAAALLRQAPPGTPDRDLLSELARVVMGRPPAEGRLAEQIACPGVPALWAALAVPRLPEGEGIAEEAIVAAHSALPDLLRRHLGAKLVSRLLAAGRDDAARAVENAMTRTGPPAAPVERLAAAEIDLRSGRRGEGERLLADLTASRSDEAAEAVIRLIESRAAAGEPAGGTLADTAAALARDYAGTPLDARLRGAELRALIGDGRFAEALDRLNGPNGKGAPPAGRDTLADLLVARIVDRADDAAFLPLAARALALAPLSPAARRPLARRLTGLGLDGMAETALALQDRDPAPEDRLILASIALLRQAPAMAIGYLSGLGGAGAADLRGRAQAQARTAAAAAGGQPDRPALAAAAPEGPLARNRALLAESRQRREALSTLLGGGQ